MPSVPTLFKLTCADRFDFAIYLSFTLNVFVFNRIIFKRFQDKWKQGKVKNYFTVFLQSTKS